MVAVLDHVAQSISSAESSSFEIDDEFVRVGCGLDVECGRAAIETFGWAIDVFDELEVLCESYSEEKGYAE